MEAGAALNNEVAQKVMGWPAPVYITDERHDPKRPIYAWRECHRPHAEHDHCEDGWRCGKEEYYPAPRYSTDIAAAWPVAEHLLRQGFRFEVRAIRGRWWAYFGEEMSREADTAPHAICLAALAAVGAPAPAPHTQEEDG